MSMIYVTVTAQETKYYWALILLSKFNFRYNVNKSVLITHIPRNILASSHVLEQSSDIVPDLS